MLLDRHVRAQVLHNLCRTSAEGPSHRTACRRQLFVDNTVGSEPDHGDWTAGFAAVCRPSPLPEEGLGSSGDSKVAAGGLMTAESAPVVLSVQITVPMALRSEAAAFLPSPRGASVSSTDEGVRVSVMGMDRW